MLHILSQPGTLENTSRTISAISKEQDRRLKGVFRVQSALFHSAKQTLGLYSNTGISANPSQ